MHKSRGYWRPGTRRQRWAEVSIEKGLILLGIAVVCAVGIDPPVGLGLAAVVGLLAILEFRDAHRGWPMSDAVPPSARRRAERSGALGQYEREQIRAWEAE